MSWFKKSDPDLVGSLGSLTQTLALLISTLTQQRKNDMAIIQSVADLITANQSLIALVNQLVTKLSTPPVPSQDVTDTAAAATSELSAVNAAIAAAQAALNPPATSAQT